MFAVVAVATVAFTIAIASTSLLGASAVILFICLLWWVRRVAVTPEFGVTAVVAILIFSSHPLALLYQLGLPADAVRSLILVKDLAAWTCLLVLILVALRRKGSATFVVLTTSYLAIVLVILLVISNSAPVEAKMAAIRGVSVPVLGLAMTGALTPEERARAAKSVVLLGLVAVLYSSAEYLFAPADYFTDILGVGSYWIEVKGQEVFINPATGLPGNFFNQQGVPRLSGSFGDPLTAGMVIAMWILLSLVTLNGKSKLIVVALGLLCLALTFTRNGWILLALGGAGYIVHRFDMRRHLPHIVLGTVIGGIALVEAHSLHAYISGILSGRDTSTIAHANFLEQNLSDSYPAIGSGWGTGGAAANAIDGLAVTRESALVALVVQAGWLPAMFMIGIVGILVAMLMRSSQYPALIAGVAASITISAAVSENILALNAGLTTFVMLGLTRPFGSGGDLDSGRTIYRQ